MARSLLGTTPALLVLFALTASAQKTPDVRLNVGMPPNSAYAANQSLAASGSAVHVVWTDSRTGGGSEVYHNRSLDAGATWLDPDVRVSDGDARPSLAQVAVQGSSVYVAWYDWRNGESDIYFNRSLDGGLNWLASDVRLDLGTTAGAQRSERVRIAAAGSSVYVVWEEEVGNFYPPGDIYFNRSLDGGNTWLPAAVRLDVGTTAFAFDSREPQIAVAGSSVYVTWHEDFSTKIAFNRSLDGGTTWLSEVKRLDSSGATLKESSFPDIAAVGASVFVTWLDSRTGSGADIYFNRSLDGGATWLAPDVRIDLGTPPGARSSILPRIAASGSSVYVAWQEHNISPSISDVYFNRSLDDGANWLASSVRLDIGDGPFAANSDLPQIAAAGSSVYVLWEDERHGTFKSDIYYNRSIDGGTTWAPTDVRLNVGAGPGTSSVRGIRIATSGSGSVYAAWYEYRGTATEPDIYFNLAAGHQPYGSGKPGSGGAEPTISAVGDPAIGGTFSLDLANGLGGATGILLYGFTGPAALPVAGGEVLVAPPIFKQLVTLGGAVGVPGAGAVSIPIAIPLDPSLIGVRANAQVGFFDAGALKGFSLTSGIETWVL